MIMDVSSFLAHMKTVFPSLTKREKEVAVYISSNYNNIVFMSLNEISKECGVGDANVIRFIKKKGFSSYKEIKTTMAEQLRNPNNENNLFTDENTYQNILQMLDDTKDLSNVSSLKKAAQNIIDSQFIYIFGLGL